MAETPTTSTTSEAPAPAETPATVPATPATALASATAPELPAAPEPEKSIGETLYPEAAAEEVAKEAVTADTPVEGEEKPTESEPAPALTVESYSELKIPTEISVSEPLLVEAKTLFVETGIAPEAGQKLLDFYAKASADSAKIQIEAWNATQAEWTSTFNAMPEFQGERKAQSLAVLGSMLDEYGDASVREMFNMTGAGNHPGLIKMLLSMGTALTEDSPHLPGKPVVPGSQKGRSIGERLGYSNS